MRRAVAVAAAGAAVALAGCRQTPPGFAPQAPGWPVGYGAGQLEPGLWAPAKTCQWQIFVAGNPLPVDMGTATPGSTVALADGVKLAAGNCGGWTLVSPWQGVS